MADNNTIARPYARAAFDVASAYGDLGTWSASLNLARELLADGQVATFLANPELDDGKRLEFLVGLFRSSGDAGVLAGDSEKGLNFLKLLLEYGRVPVLPEIADHFDTLKARVENSVDVTVTSAVALSPEQQQAIGDALRAKLGSDVRIETEIDENLIAGAIIRAGDVVIDGSLRSRLEGLSNVLTA